MTAIKDAGNSVPSLMEGRERPRPKANHVAQTRLKSDMIKAPLAKTVTGS